MGDTDQQKGVDDGWWLVVVTNNRGYQAASLGDTHPANGELMIVMPKFEGE